MLVADLILFHRASSHFLSFFPCVSLLICPMRQKNISTNSSIILFIQCEHCDKRRLCIRWWIFVFFFLSLALLLSLLSHFIHSLRFNDFWSVNNESFAFCASLPSENQSILNRQNSVQPNRQQWKMTQCTRHQLQHRFSFISPTEPLSNSKKTMKLFPNRGWSTKFTEL